MKNTKIMNKHFILGAALLTAVLVFTGCNHDSANVKDIPEQEKQSIVISGSFAFEGAIPKQLLLAKNNPVEKTDRSATISADSLSSLYEDDFEFFIQVYFHPDSANLGGNIGGGNPDGSTGGGKPGKPDFGGGGGIMLTDPMPYEDAECSIDVENKTWSAEIFESGDYSVKIGVVKAGTKPSYNGYATNDILLIGETDVATISITSEIIASNLNRHLSVTEWNKPIKLLPNKGFEEGHKEYTNNEPLEGYGSNPTLTQYQANIPKINLKFRMPKNSGISYVSGTFYDEENNSCTISCVESETPEWNNFSESGDYRIATYTATALLAQNGNYSGTLSFLDSDQNLVYFCTEVINLIPGFETNTWSGEGPYTDDGEYFDLTQQMIDDFNSAYEGSSIIPAKAISGASSNKYPVVLFDDGVKLNNCSVYNTTIPSNATLYAGIPLAKGFKVYDFAIAPICANQSKTVQRIFTIENRFDLVMYPSYAGYQAGEVIANLYDNDFGYYGKIISLYAAHDGYVYVVLSDYGYDNNVGENCNRDIKLKRVCVLGNPGDDDFGVVETINFVNSSNETITFRAAVHPDINEYTAMASNYRLVSYWGYLYLCYVYDVNGSNSFCCRKMLMSSATNGVVPVDASNAATFELISKPVSEVAPDSGLSNTTIISDSMVIPQVNSSTGEPEKSGAALYMLAACRKNGSGETKGGVIKLADIVANNFSSTNAFVKVGSSDNSPYIRGCWQPANAGETISYPMSQDEEKIYFYGPSRFVARKPDELVIADEESYAYKEGSNDKEHNTDSVVTLNLSTFANGNSQMTRVPVETKFSWHIETSCDYGIIYKAYSDQN